MDKPFVSVQMITYNHEPYVAQAIEGVLQQQTNFPFELVIGEDCSTDGTREIVFEYQKKYPDIIRVITSDTNVGMHKNGCRTTKACLGKYIAYCEGDDYWHHPQKLQKQVDYLETHPDVGLVHSDINMYYQNTGYVVSDYRSSKRRKGPIGKVYNELLLNNFISTCTVCARRELVCRCFTLLNEDLSTFIMGDYPLWLFISLHSEIGYIDESLATYRVLLDSACHGSDYRKRISFGIRTYKVKWFFVSRFGCSNRTRNMIDRNYNTYILRSAFDARDPSLLDREPLRNVDGYNPVDRLYKIGLKGMVLWYLVKIAIYVYRWAKNQRS